MFPLTYVFDNLYALPVENPSLLSQQSEGRAFRTWKSQVRERKLKFSQYLRIIKRRLPEITLFWCYLCQFVFRCFIYPWVYWTFGNIWIVCVWNFEPLLNLWCKLNDFSDVVKAKWKPNAFQERSVSPFDLSVLILLLQCGYNRWSEFSPSV